jgi:hypothetical protein
MSQKYNLDKILKKVITITSVFGVFSFFFVVFGMVFLQSQDNMLASLDSTVNIAQTTTGTTSPTNTISGLLSDTTSQWQCTQIDANKERCNDSVGNICYLDHLAQIRTCSYTDGRQCTYNMQTNIQECNYPNGDFCRHDYNTKIQNCTLAQNAGRCITDFNTNKRTCEYTNGARCVTDLNTNTTQCSSPTTTTTPPPTGTTTTTPPPTGTTTTYPTSTTTTTSSTNTTTTTYPTTSPILKPTSTTDNLSVTPTTDTYKTQRDNLVKINNTLTEAQQTKITTGSDIIVTTNQQTQESLQGIQTKDPTTKPLVESSQVKNQITVRKENFVDAINSALRKISPYQDDEVIQLEKLIDEYWQDLERILSEHLGRKVDLSYGRHELAVKVAELRQKMTKVREKLDKQGGLDIYKDTDGDGVSDYDEINIYKTDPNKASTAGGSLNDGQKILRNMDPLQKEDVLIEFDDPKLHGEELKGVFEVTEVKMEKTVSEKETSVPEELVFNGKAIPKSFVTLYVFSTPIIATVQANEDGEWTYRLTQQLEDGNHEIYVASVDNTGKIVAKSPSIPFVKEATAAQLVSFQDTNAATSGDKSNSMWQKNYGVLGVGIFVIVVGLGFVLAGFAGRNKDKEIDI